jgi:predicted Zn finger-like uncharacterized protein
MFTQCPDCRKTFPITKKQLRGKKAQIFCGDCKKKFNALTLLDEKSTALVTEAKAEYIPKADFNQTPRPKRKSEIKQHSITETLSKLKQLIIRPDSPEHEKKTEESPVEGLIHRFLNVLSKTNSNSASIDSVASESTPERLPWEIEKSSVNVLWIWGVIIGSLFLLGQLIYFESGKLSQNASYRPALDKLCRWLGCHLSDYENLAELAVLQGSFTPNVDNTMAFKAAINNQAPFKQHLPNIKLTLLDYNEQIFAQRIFTPKEYLSGADTNFSISPDETVAASLTIAAPKTPIGGYNFDLVY